MMCRGIIEKALSGFYYVNTGDRVISCRARGKFRKEKISPLVGDWVQVQELENGTGYIELIEPRKCAFVRPAVANIDQLVIIASEAVPVNLLNQAAGRKGNMAHANIDSIRMMNQL